MCTVSYVPTTDGFCLTSNRDEKVSRKSAVSPKILKKKGYSLLFPKDAEKNGTWIAAKNTGAFAVLLNGAFTTHAKKACHTKSRGIVLLELVMKAYPYYEFKKANLEQTEPFTLILFTAGNLYECRWDGAKKHVLRLDPAKPYIWSSATLYSKKAASIRSTWFNHWYRSNTEEKTAIKVLAFHKFDGDEDLENGLIINRENKIRTVSITQIHVSSNNVKMTYNDLCDDSLYVEEMTFKNAPRKEISAGRLALKSLLIRLFHWEYWPMNIVYAPVMLYWFWLSLKSKSLFFFSTSNPLIKNGGFTLESKADIYNLIPAEYYPKTLRFSANATSIQVTNALIGNNLSYPVIAKPDIGARGIQVQLLKNHADLSDYLHKTQVDFLIQERIPYKNEIGIFYYRIPGEKTGHISGIVGKKFLAVKGNGKSTIRELILAEPRHLLQFKKLKATFGNLLNEVLPDQEKLVLVPYGSHSRGSEFIDLSHHISNKLSHTIDMICQEIPEFYFGRLDVMYNTWEELCEGKNFAIVELNGAGSEPTHIYDPKHSIFFAWKEIMKHWQILYKISKLNKQKGLSYMTYKQGIQMLRENAKYFKTVA
jgi:uncharacterized protein with NRDE domain